MPFVTESEEAIGFKTKMDDLRSKNESRKDVFIGWYHTHPALTVYMRYNIRIFNNKDKCYI